MSGMEKQLPAPIIQAKAVRFRWRQDRPDVLNIPELNIQQGDRLFIRGASGCGKSSLLALLAGVALPQAGEIIVLDQTINRLSGPGRDHFRADHIGFVFQLFNLIPYLSVLENVILPCRFSQRRKQSALANSATLEQEALRLLAHLELASPGMLHSPVTELSVGQQQRVATARALMGSPEILIADEPTSALDSDLRESFIRLLFRECDTFGSTLVFVSHDRRMEQLFEQHVTLEEINQAKLDTC